MFRGYRGILIAACGVVLLAAALPPQHGGQAEQAKPQQDQQTTTSPLPISQPPVESADKADNTNQPCEAGQDNRSSDLCAQWKAADAAKESADWTRRSYWLIFAGSVIGAATLFAAIAAAKFARDAAIHTKAGADHAARSADAADRAIVASEKIGSAQVRAYLYCKSATYELGKDRISAIVEIANAGQSPAAAVTISGSVNIHDVGGMPSMPRVLAWVGSETTTVEVQPIVANGSVLGDVSFFWDLSFLVEADEHSFKESIFRTGNEAWFDLTVGWKDVFDRQHEFTVSMSAAIDASPYNPKKKRSRTGKMEIRMNDPRYRDIGPKADS